VNETGPTILQVDGVPAFVVLRYDEYQRLLKLASASPARPSEVVGASVERWPAAQNDQPQGASSGVRVPAFDNQTAALIPANGFIPHEVVVAAVHNHWSLARAWREYFGLSQQDVAKRMGISVCAFASMETEFYRVAPLTRERLAEGLGIGLDQLVSRQRRLRRKDYE
jgi:DNA-binding XRE family transcriptional regulator